MTREAEDVRAVRQRGVHPREARVRRDLLWRESRTDERGAFPPARGAAEALESESGFSYVRTGRGTQDDVGRDVRGQTELRRHGGASVREPKACSEGGISSQLFGQNRRVPPGLHGRVRQGEVKIPHRRLSVGALCGRGQYECELAGGGSEHRNRPSIDNELDRVSREDSPLRFRLCRDAVQGVMNLHERMIVLSRPRLRQRGRLLSVLTTESEPPENRTARVDGGRSDEEVDVSVRPHLGRAVEPPCHSRSAEHYRLDPVTSESLDDLTGHVLQGDAHVSPFRGERAPATVRPPRSQP